MEKYEEALGCYDKALEIDLKDVHALVMKGSGIATGDLADEITKLKSQDGKDIIVYGDVSFDSSLIRAGLIDEFHLLINPVAIGNGMTIFKDLNEIQKFNLER